MNAADLALARAYEGHVSRCGLCTPFVHCLEGEGILRQLHTTPMVAAPTSCWCGAAADAWEHTALNSLYHPFGQAAPARTARAA